MKEDTKNGKVSYAYELEELMFSKWLFYEMQSIHLIKS